MKILSKTYPLDLFNIDTDQIIPAQYLKQVDRTGLSKVLFYNWRFDESGVPKDFPLNEEKRKGAEVIVAGKNFGCGSSREHAAWALADFGVRAIVSEQFADIFKTNAFYSGILLIELEREVVQQMMRFSEGNPEGKIEINLENQTISMVDLKSHQIAEWAFVFDAFKKECLLNGINETEYIINHKSEIAAFEEKHNY